MNILKRVRKDMQIANMLDLKTLIYASLLSDVIPKYDKSDDVKYGVYSEDVDSVYDRFHDWNDDDVQNALTELSNEGYIFFDEDNLIYLGEYRGKRFFTFEVKSSLYDQALNLLNESLERYKKGSAKSRSRGRYIQEVFERITSKGVEQLRPGDFTELHGYLYEIYTGGEVYVLRNKQEHFQTTNMLKAYDKHTVFAILVEGVLNFDTYRRKGVPTLTTISMEKDTVFKGLTRGSGSKDYMRTKTETIDEDGF